MTIQEICKDPRCVPGAKIKRPRTPAFQIDEQSLLEATHCAHLAADDWQFVEPPKPKPRRERIIELCDEQMRYRSTQQYPAIVELIDLIRAELAESPGPKFKYKPGDKVTVCGLGPPMDGCCATVTGIRVLYTTTDPQSLRWEDELKIFD